MLYKQQLHKYYKNSMKITSNLKIEQKKITEHGNRKSFLKKKRISRKFTDLYKSVLKKIMTIHE